MGSTLLFLLAVTFQREKSSYGKSPMSILDATTSAPKLLTHPYFPAWPLTLPRIPIALGIPKSLIGWISLKISLNQEILIFAILFWLRLLCYESYIIISLRWKLLWSIKQSIYAAKWRTSIDMHTDQEYRKDMMTSQETSDQNKAAKMFI